jgi:hypothetical protein
MKEYLRVHFPAEEKYDLRDFKAQVSKVIMLLDNSTVMDCKMLPSCQLEQSQGYDEKVQICEI